MPFNAGISVGPYRILEQLGQGGMATVYKAYHASLDRYVAVKVLHQAFLEDSTFQARFQREARLVARLEHPNIVPIYDYAEYEGQPYLVMKYIEGETLKARLQRGPLSGGEVERIIDSVGAGLAYAHKQGILHRDIKPSNVILAKDGGIYLADFGLARIAQSGESTLTSDMVLGTPQYISPEQALGKKDLDEGTDIYSFGVMLYEIVVGRVPYSADTPFSVIHDHIYAPLPLPSSVNPRISDDMERILLKALSKERADRYADVPALVQAFKQAWSDSAPTQLSPSLIPPPDAAVTQPPQVSAARTAPAAPPPPVAAPPGKPAATKPARPIRWMWVALAVLACLCCIITFIATRPDNRPAGVNPQRTVQAAITDVVPPEIQPTVVAALQETPAQPERFELKNLGIEQARKLVERDPNSPGAHLELGAALIRDGKEKEGYEEIRQASELAKDQPVFLMGAARAMEANQNWLGAFLFYLRIAKNNPARPQELVEALHRTAYYGFEAKIAPEVAEFGIISGVDEPTSLIAQARYVHMHRNDPEKEQALVNDLRAQSPEIAEADLLQSELSISQKDIPAATKILQSLLERPIPDWVRQHAEGLLKSIQ
jgi:tRNA A-37 threonylcarbamoyl transferase component Bud32